jgi:hypothetical protein
VLRLWGAFQFAQVQTVDPQGNVFLPNIGPVALGGVRNADLQRVVAARRRAPFAAMSMSMPRWPRRSRCASMSAGSRRPGLYDGTSMDGLLHYLDAAGGIDPDRGTFIDVEVKRGSQVRAPRQPLPVPVPGPDGARRAGRWRRDLRGPRQQTVTVTGLANNPNIFEFPRQSHPTTADVMLLAAPQPAATTSASPG